MLQYQIRWKGRTEWIQWYHRGTQQSVERSYGRSNFNKLWSIKILTAYKDDNELMLKCLKEYTNDNNFILPKFLFYADCSYVAFIMKNGMKEKFDIYEGMFYK